jgi:hypothetical protein
MGECPKGHCGCEDQACKKRWKWFGWGSFPVVWIFWVVFLIHNPGIALICLVSRPSHSAVRLPQRTPSVRMVWCTVDLLPMRILDSQVA